MLTVITSVVRSPTSISPPGTCSAIVALVVGEGDGLAANREVAALRPADVVLGQQDPGQVGVALELDPEEVEGFALLEVRGGKDVDTGGDRGKGVGTGA